MTRRVAKVVVYACDTRKFLVEHRAADHGVRNASKWGALGGKLEEGETFQAAARREVLEESGLTISELTFIFSFSAQPGAKLDDVQYFFAAIPKQLEVTASAESQALAWLTRDEIIAKQCSEGLHFAFSKQWGVVQRCVERSHESEK